MKAPIAIIIFNRPDHVAKLYECIKSEKDRDLFIISDGARTGNPNEEEKVEICRKVIKNWTGNIYCNFAEQNMGCRERVTSGLSWVFEHTDRAIILEDDCLPHPDFFKFTDELLVKYEHDTRVMSICGTNVFSNRNYIKWSYCFSKYQNCWGWATWKRSWDLFDPTLSNLPLAKETDLLREHLGSRRASMYWHYMLEKVRNGRINSWAYIWTFTSFVHHGLHIIPKYNLIQNAGFGIDATHTTEIPEYLSTKIQSLEFPLLHPPTVFPLFKYDQTIEDIVFSKSLFQRFLWLIRKIGRSIKCQIPI